MASGARALVGKKVRHRLPSPRGWSEGRDCAESGGFFGWFFGVWFFFLLLLVPQRGSGSYRAAWMCVTIRIQSLALPR